MRKIAVKLLRFRYVIPGLLALAVAGGLAYMFGPASALNQDTPDGCAACHTSINPSAGTAVMGAVVSDWKVSEHANSLDEPGSDNNDYCARCKSPFEGNPAWNLPPDDPDRPTERVEVDPDDWQGITCRVCHPPHDTPDFYTGEIIEGVGLFIGSQLEPDEDGGLQEAWIEITDPGRPADSHAAEQLCTEYCHTGSRHGVDWRGAGKHMREYAGLTCYDCHMAEVSGPVEPADGCDTCHAEKTTSHLYANHTWEPSAYPEDTCLREGCHSNKQVHWAEKASERSAHQPPGQVR